MQSPVAYDDVARALGAVASAVHPAEAHGCLCGALCVRRGYAFPEWLDEILPDAPTGPAGDDVLERLFATSEGVLARREMEFQPLLPGDEEALRSRVDALAAWCQGFLYGFGAAGAPARTPPPDTVSEVLGDLAQIAQVGALGSDAAEVEEGAYVELVEFLRAAVQLVYEELEAVRAAQPASRSLQ